jgi:hypothetical protein
MSSLKCSHRANGFATTLNTSKAANTIKKDIHDIIVQQNDIKKKYNHENIEIEYTLCNASTMCYVFEITKTLEFMKYKNNRNTFKTMIWIPS